MNGYRVEFARSARQELERLPARVVERVMAIVRSLAETPRPRQSRKLAGEEGTYRVRVGDYRVVYEVEDQTRVVLVTRVRHRKDVYD